jgi:hypothetical protein
VITSCVHQLLSGILAIILCVTSVAPAQAAFDHAVTWSDISDIDLRPVFQSGYANSSSMMEPVIPSSALALALRDEDNRVGPEFNVFPEMMERTSFWLRVYTEFTTQHVVIFDSHHPEIIYEVLDFRDLARTSRNAIAYEVVMKRRVKKTMASYRKAFANLLRKKRPKNLNAFEQRVLAATGANSHKHALREHARWLRSQTGQRDNVMKGLVAAEAYFPKMEQLFTELGVPPELTRLTLVESSFNLKAYSRVGAAGVWQFMPKTAREYMTINHRSRIDERLSPLKSTVAAAKLLKRHYRMLGNNWTLATISYNHGFRGLKEFRKKREVSQEEVNRIFIPCSKKARLGFASRNYYAEFLAVILAEAYRDVFYGPTPFPTIHAVAFERVKPGQTGMQVIEERSLTTEQFKFLNPDIRDLRKPLPRGFWIALPGESDNMIGLTEPSSKGRSG